MSIVADSPYAPSRVIATIDECSFYHTIELPDVGLVPGIWDLRDGVSDYLGNVELDGKRVLEVGTASGFVCFEMERRGADVVAYDLSDEVGSWDLVPFGGTPDASMAAERSRGLRLLNNGFWFAHTKLNSKARVVYGSAYEVPDAIGPVDVATFGCVLLHLRDPFLALERALRLTKESVIVTEVASRPALVMGRLPKWTHSALARSRLLPAGVGFMPDHWTGKPDETWWRLTPWGVSRMLGVLGFDVCRVVFHTKLYGGKPYPLYTLVAKRPRGQTAPILRADDDPLRGQQT
jgi:SAM-dependent methyltransferase